LDYIRKLFCVDVCEKAQNFSDCPPLERKKNKNKLFKSLTPFWLFSNKIGQSLAADKSGSYLALCELTAEQSASWQHWYIRIHAEHDNLRYDT
jgi:hypothetical protein